MREHDSAVEEEDLVDIVYGDDRVRSESYQAEEPHSKRARGDEEDNDDDDKRLLSLVLRGCDVMELFSPERVGRVCHKHQLVPGPALDLRTGYNFDRPADRTKAMRLYEETQPELVTLSPPCTEFSRLQALNRHCHGEAYKLLHDELKQRAIKHLEFCFRFARMQIRKGRYFLFEHPAAADSWSEPCVQRLLNLPGVEVTIADQCQFGLVTKSPEGELKPALKPTRFASNSWLLLEELTRRCPHEHDHQPLMGGRAAAAAEYRPDLCNAICRGLVRQKQYARQSYVATPKQGKSELKALIRKLSVMACAEATTSARPDATKRVPHSASGVERVQMLRKQADSTIEHMVR